MKRNFSKRNCSYSPLLPFAMAENEFFGNEEENADFSELDYDYSSVQEKIAAGLREKEKGNKLFAQGRYEEAWKQYDACFVHIYTSKEEWAAIGDFGRNNINQFKLPCHLNRGLCRLRKDDLKNALWDFSEALRIDENNAKGMYRMGVVLTKLVRIDMAKEGTGELWDLDLAEERLEDAKVKLMQAVKAVPNDKGIRIALDDLRSVREELAVHQKKYRKDQKELYSTFISNLDRENQRLEDAEDKDVFENMPKLERIRIG